MRRGARFYSVAAVLAAAIGMGPSWIAGATYERRVLDFLKARLRG